MIRHEAAWEQVGLVWRGQGREATLAEQLAARVQRQSRRMRLVLAGEVIITLAVMGFVFGVMRGVGTPVSFRIAAATLLYTAGVWAFALWNRRGTWQPYGATTADFLALLRLRAERRIRSAWFCLTVVAAAAAFTVSDIAAAWGEGRVPPWEWSVWLAYCAAMIVWSLWYRWRAKAEIRGIDAMIRAQLGS